jgi:hypothetical protein
MLVNGVGKNACGAAYIKSAKAICAADNPIAGPFEGGDKDFRMHVEGVNDI